MDGLLASVRCCGTNMRDHKHGASKVKTGVMAHKIVRLNQKLLADSAATAESALPA